MDRQPANIIDIQRNEEFLKLFTKHQRRIYSTVLTLVPSKTDADDIMQETLMTMWRKFDQFQPGSNFVAWGLQIATYKVLNLNSTKWHRVIRFDPEVIEMILNKSQEMAEDMDKHLDALLFCVKKLNNRQSKLIGMKYEGGLKCKHIAQKLGISVDGVYKSLARLHESLLACVKRRVSLEE